MPHRRHDLNFSGYAGVCENSGTRYPEGVLFDATNHGNLLPKTLAFGGEENTTSRCSHLASNLSPCKTLRKRFL